MAVILPTVINTIVAVIFGFILQLISFMNDIKKCLFFGQEITEIDRKHVVITGCDTGFGHFLTLRLLRRGVTVYSGCLTDAGITNLESQANNSNSLHCFSLDVTKDASVMAAKMFVANKLQSQGLWGLVCNSGVAGPTTPDDWNTVHDFINTMDVNFMGHVRMTHAFRSLMRANGKEEGRLVYMCSMMGHITGPFTLPYNVSKRAAVAYADCLRTELTSTNLKVVTICPGFFKTNITQMDPIRRQHLARWRELDENVRIKYGPNDANKLPLKIDEHLEALQTTMEQLSANNSVDQVLDAYEKALLSAQPKLTYWVGADAAFVRVFEHLSEYAQTMVSRFTRKIMGDPL